jgi:hypothetical protein
MHWQARTRQLKGVQVMAAAGIDSRRRCEGIIAAGRVQVNGNVVTLPQTPVTMNKDKILVDGSAIQTVQKCVYLMVNKPKGYVCSSVHQPGLSAKPVVTIVEPFIGQWLKGKPVGAIPPRLFTVGRLDVSTTGLILLTNDGAWAQRVSHPSAGMPPQGLPMPCRHQTPTSSLTQRSIIVPAGDQTCQLFCFIDRYTTARLSPQAHLCQVCCCSES